MKLSKNKIIGLAALLAVVLVLGGSQIVYSAMQSMKRDNAPKSTQTVNGYLGGEKISLFDDGEFDKLLAGQGLKVDYRKAGSLDMMTASRTGMDYLFPSSKAAVEYGKSKKVDVSKADTVFNSPIVLYTYRNVADALCKSGLIGKDGGTYHMDMAKAAQDMLDGKSWADLGYTQGYGQFHIDSTDPAKSNSGNMYAALLATVLNDGQPATVESINRDGDKIKRIFAKSGWMETSSEDSFSQFLTLGVGSKPMMVGYESQLLDFAANNAEAFKQIKDNVVMVYPTPTVWSSHVLVPLDEKGERLLKTLKSKPVQQLAWRKHGFRSANFLGADSISRFHVSSAAEQVTSVTELPNAQAMTTLIDLLAQVPKS